MTDDMRRMINILVDWMLIQQQAPDCLFERAVVMSILDEGGDHADRMQFALSIVFGIDPDSLSSFLGSEKGYAGLQEILLRCSRVFLKS